MYDVDGMRRGIILEQMGASARCQAFYHLWSIYKLWARNVDLYILIYVLIMGYLGISIKNTKENNLNE